MNRLDMAMHFWDEGRVCHCFNFTLPNRSVDSNAFIIVLLLQSFSEKRIVTSVFIFAGRDCCGIGCSENAEIHAGKNRRLGIDQRNGSITGVSTLKTTGAFNI